MDVLGNDWGKQRAAEILRESANNPGAGGAAAAGAGIGMGDGSWRRFFAGMAQQMLNR